jgi:hypothetical protein
MIRVLFLLEITTTELIIIACLNANSASPAVLVVIKAVTDLGFRCRSDEHLLVPLYTRKTSFIAKKSKEIEREHYCFGGSKAAGAPSTPLCLRPCIGEWSAVNHQSITAGSRTGGDIFIGKKLAEQIHWIW